MNLQKYTKKVLWTLIDYDWVRWSQCVDLIKSYTNEVYKIRLWTFWWSAKSWWLNKSNTFKKDIWDRIPNDKKNSDQVPKPWDIIFFEWTKYWHVAIVLSAIKWENKVTVLEQNMWDWNWYWLDDKVSIWAHTYTKSKLWLKVSWWYSLKVRNECNCDEFKKEIAELKKKIAKVKDFVKNI